MKKEQIQEHYFDPYSTAEYPVPDGKLTKHRPRRNYWGNLSEEDTYSEDTLSSPDYDYSSLDYEDDHDNFYNDDNYK